MIIFTHIAKSAGSSIKAGIGSNFKNSYYANDISKMIEHPNIYERIINNIPIDLRPDIISNHLPYGVHMLFKDVKCSYFTFLRHPISRAASCFYHQNRNPVTSKMGKRKIVDILQWCLSENINCDVMTRQLSGIDNLGSLILPDVVRKTGGIYHAGIKLAVCNDEKMNTMFEKSKYNLKHRYSFIGFQENGISDMTNLCNYYGWEFKNPLKRFKSRTRSHKDWETKEVIRVLKKMNSYDMKLYNYARTL